MNSQPSSPSLVSIVITGLSRHSVEGSKPFGAAPTLLFMTVQALWPVGNVCSKKILPQHEEVRTGLAKQLDLVLSGFNLIPWGS